MFKLHYTLLGLIFFSSIFINGNSKDINNDIKIADYKIERRNETLCKKNGDVWGNCSWTLKFNIKNNTSNNINSFCTILKSDKKKYNLCYSKKNKSDIKASKTRYIYINLKKHMGIKNDRKKPVLKMISFKPIFD